MSHELNLRQKAIRWKQAGRAVSWICQRLEHSREWFYKWWNRYQAEGASGLRDRSRAPQSNPRRWSSEMRHAILDIRDRLMRRRGPRARYRLAGAATIRHELACLGYKPLPSLRTIERVLQQGKRTSPAFRPEPCASSSGYPMFRVTHSNQRHQLDLIGPRYLKGSRRQWYFLVYRDVYDGAVFVEFQPKPRMPEVLAFVVRAWQRLGLPDILQIDNSDLFGLTSHPGSLNRFIRLALLVGIKLTFIPEHEPWRNGAIEHFNGWLQERILAIPLHAPTHVRRELRGMMDTCFHEHIHPHLDFQTTAQIRKHLSPRTLPHNFRRHLEPLPVAIGRVTFIRRVRPSGRITILGVKFKVSKRLAHQYVSASLYTRTMLLKIHARGRLLKQFDFPFIGKLKLNPKSIRAERSVSVHYLTWCAETAFVRAPSLNFTFVDYVEQLPCSQNYKRKLINSAKLFFEWVSIHRKGFRSISPEWLHTFRFKTYPEEFDEEKTISKDEIVLISKLPTESLLEQRVQAGTCFLYLSGMRVSAFTSMPIKAVDLQKLEVRQSPSLGMITKNKKSATTYILDIKEIFETVRKWDTFVRSRLPVDAYWFAPLLSTTGELDLNPAKANENRSHIFRKNLKKWLTKNQVTLHTPHAFRRGHANFLFDHASDIGDIDAARENLMHDNLATTELYARKRRAQIKSRIQNMVHPAASSGESLDLHAKVSHVEEKVELLYELLRSKNEN